MPATPGEVFVRSFTDDKISVTWGEALAGSGFLRYRLTIIPEDAIQDTLFVYPSDPDLVATFIGLDHATLYTITLQLEPTDIESTVQQVTRECYFSWLFFYIKLVRGLSCRLRGLFYKCKDS